MNTANINNADELTNILKICDISLPPMGCGRTKDNNERFAICMLLSSLAEAKQFTYPLKLIHQDKPDFKLLSASGITGIEVTFAMNQNQAHFKAKINRLNGQEIYSTKVFQPDASLSGDVINKLIDEEITGYPLMGDQPYENWATYVSHSINKKFKDFNKPDFEKLDKNVLVVIVETPERIAVQDINKAIRYLSLPLNKI